MKYSVSDPVVYFKAKNSSHLPRSEFNFRPSESGENYSYTVKKFWTISQVYNDGFVEVVTRRGKRHKLQESDPLLRPAFPWERIMQRSRFPKLDQVPPQAPIPE